MGIIHNFAKRGKGMKKRYLALLFALALLVGLFSACARVDETQEPTDAEGSYLAGYAIKDINPWADYEDHSKGIQIYLFNLTGNGDDSSRPVYGLFDDNGDNTSGDGDGLFVTCTAVQDPSGTTVLFVTLDALGAQADLTADAREAIVEAMGDKGITEDRIFINASHTHSGPSFAALKKGNDAQKAYYDYVIDQIAAAAAEAYGDLSPAKLRKGTVNAKEATAELGYNGGKGYHMNAIRHYEVTMTGSDGNAYSYMVGSGGALDNTDVAFKSIRVSKNEYKTVDEADNDMHVLLFEVDGKDDIVFVNWRAHTTMNSGVEKTLLSSDYVNGLRTVLGKEGYRSAFFQGAAGNVVTAPRAGVWTNDTTLSDWLQAVLNEETKTYTYGKMLAQIALSCIDDIKDDMPLPVGNIQTKQAFYSETGNRQTYSEGLKAAAQSAKDNGISNYPYRYTHTDGKVYIVNTANHRNKILSTNNVGQLELNTILFGNEVAFVTAPNEIVDKYHVYKDGDEYSAAPNDWDNLINDETYGTPFVLGYTNGAKGYIGNWLDFAQNSQEYTDITGYAENGEEFFSPGNYESMTSAFKRGAGEEIVAQLGAMLAN